MNDEDLTPSNAAKSEQRSRTMMPTALIKKELALIDELRTAIKLIQIGLKTLQQIDGGNDFYHLPFLTLANGIERLLKAIYIFHLLEKTHDFPKEYPWEDNKTRKGHDLIYLLNLITEDCIHKEYIAKIPVGAKDYKFLTTDRYLRKHVEILSNFGTAHRYYNLNLIKGIAPSTGSPEKEWQHLESAIFKKCPEWEESISKDPNMDIAYKHINTEITILFEKMARALCRLFTIGKLGEKAKQHSHVVHPFAMLDDDKLGIAQY